MLHSPLRMPLLLNATFSLGTGVLLFFNAEAIHRLMGPATPVAFKILGAVLIGYSLGLYALVARPNALLTLFVSLADVSWVVGSAVILIGWSQAFTTRGAITTTGIAAVVALFGWLQLRAIRRVFRAPGDACD